jgi:predicted site-specific integrase-resolvase
MAVRLVALSDLFPNVHRVTLYRWRRSGKLPPPDITISGRAYYREDRFAPPDDDAEREAEASQQKADVQKAAPIRGPPSH